MSAVRAERWLPWALRATWVVVLWAGGDAIDRALAGRDARAGVIEIVAAIVWLAGVLAMSIPAVATLTAVRVIVPLALPAAVIASIAGADADGNAVSAALFLTGAVVACTIAFTAELGRAFVQASAYGDEDRHPLRAPTAYIAAAALAWSVAAAAAITATILLADGRWLPGAVLAAAALGVASWAWPRWHRLSRRWFVIVPVGLVVHDHLVLGETLMVRRQELRAVRLAPAGTEAADLTGPAAGHAVEILVHEPVTAIFASTPREPRGRVIHLTGCLIAPTRPGRALRAAGQRRFPVG